MSRNFFAEARSPDGKRYLVHQMKNDWAMGLEAAHQLVLFLGQ
jgi:hypothetical protein